MTNEQTITVKQEVLDEDDSTNENNEMEVDGIVDEETIEDDVPRLGPAALGLQRVGTPAAPKPPPTQPTQVLNARGMPARIRKKNKLFFDDDIVNTPHHRVPSSKKIKTSSSTTTTPTSSATSTPTRKYSTRINSNNNTPLRFSSRDHTTPNKKYLQSKDLKTIRNNNNNNTAEENQTVQLHSPDRKIGQKIGLRLRNLLKLPKAHKWVCHEWFYSNVDRCLFFGENDFSICLKESFPELKTRELTRIEWTKIRRMMGKPRRCSQSFFNEERLELEKKRKKIRALQQRKATDMSNFKDLPAEIPMQLVIGTKVTARLRKPQDGLFTGSIDAVDTSNNTYRITFERQGLGTHSVPDYEVLSNEAPETISLQSFQNKFRPRNGLSTTNPTTTTPSPYHHNLQNKLTPYSNMKLKKDPLLSDSMINKPNYPLQQLQQQMQQQQQTQDGRIGGFPKKFLEKMVLVSKILKVKNKSINQLKSLNLEAEKYKSFDLEIPEDFERKYANVLIDLEKLNHDLEIYLNDMQLYCQEIAPEPSVAAMLAPSHLREKCRENAELIIQGQNPSLLSNSNDSVIDLITDLTALMLQVKSLADSDQNAYELQVLQGTMEQIKRKLNGNNQRIFQDSVEIHMKHIQVGLGQANNDKKFIVNGLTKI